MKKRSNRIKVNRLEASSPWILKVILILVILMVGSVKIYGQTLEDYLQEAAENNPGLQARYNNYMASMQRVDQVGVLPDPTVTFGFFVQQMPTLMGDQQFEMSLMQMFPWFGMLKTQKDEASLMAKVQYENFKSAKNALFLEVKTAYFQLYLLDENLRISQENLETLLMMERLATARIRGGNTQIVAEDLVSEVQKSEATSGAGSSEMNMGESTMNGFQSPSKSMGGEMGMSSGSGGKLTDVFQIQIQIKEMEAQLAQLADDRKVMQTRFNLLLNREESDRVLVEKQIMDRDVLERQEVLLDSVLVHNPMLKMLEAEGEVFRKKGEMARLEGKPMLGLGLEYMAFQARSPQGSIGSEMGYTPGGMGGNMVMPMVSVSLPLYRKKYKASIRESEHYREATEYRKEDQRNELKEVFESVNRDIQKANRNIRLYQEQVGLLGQTKRLMVTAYANAEGTMEDLLQVQQQLLEYELKLEAAKVKKQTAIARLEMLMASGV